MSQQASKQKLSHLEGLRGIAAFVVLLGHLRLTLFIESTAYAVEHRGGVWGTMLESLFDGGFAVWLFWVMSAFVLSIRFHKSPAGEKPFLQMTDATIRRYPRLFLPVFASVVFAWVLHACGLMSNVKLAEVLWPGTETWLGSFYLFDSNALAALNSAVWESFFAYEASTSYNEVLWTMEIELFGSFFLFAYLCLFGKHETRWLFYLITMVIVFVLKIHWINAFVLGTMLCDMHINRERLVQRIPASLVRCCRYVCSKMWILILATPVLMFFVGLRDFKGVFHLMLATALTGYLVISPPAQKIFSHSIPVFLGKISFGLYLAHLPIICAFAYPVYNGFASMVEGQAALILTAGVLLVLSLLGGWGLWFIADRPAIAFSRTVARFMGGGGVLGKNGGKG